MWRRLKNFVKKTHEGKTFWHLWWMGIMWGFVGVGLTYAFIWNISNGRELEKEMIVTGLVGIIGIIVFFAYMAVIKELKSTRQ